MCGITGIFDFSRSTSKEDLTAIVRKMNDAVRHRGPDDSGIWVEAADGIALGHQRLSVIDLSAAGHQPMVSYCGRYVIALNGEIYNFHELRKELENNSPSNSVIFRGNSDTEVLLACISRWGILESLRRLIGMFAFVLWDKKEKLLTLARDRMGEKPFYYGRVGHSFLFGSELKALRAHPRFSNEIDRSVLTLYLRHNYVPSPYSIYQNIYKLPPGSTLTVHGQSEISPFPEAVAERHKTQPVYFWSLDEIAREAVQDPFQGGDEEAIDQLDQLLGDSVRRQMISDVPLGAFLSGGIDSSAVVALMQTNSSRPVKTFSIGFHEKCYNEGEYAKAVAEYLGTDHTELYITSEEAMAVIPQLPAMYDEPFADSSQIPTYLLSKLTRHHVIVSLSGDGGDELFSGYDRYFSGHRLWNMIGWMPIFLRTAIGKAVLLSPEVLLNAAFFWLSPDLRKYDNAVVSAGYNLHRAADVFGVRTFFEFYQRCMSHWKDPLSLVLGSDGKSLQHEPAYIFNKQRQSKPWDTGRFDVLNQMMQIDALSYLPDDILVKVDRASMANSLESRIPLLDYRIVEFALRLPISMKYRNGKGKWILRQLLYRYVPEQMVERPKMGFGVPIDRWLRGPLKEWAESLLDTGRLSREGYFRPEMIRRKWQEHLSAKRNWHYELWNILMFQSWMEKVEQH